jgi:hypothetical protein
MPPRLPRIFAPRPSTAYPQRAVHNCRFRLTNAWLRLTSRRPVHRGRLRRRARVGAGCGVLRAWLVTTPPGGVRQHRPSATTSGTRECANARSRAPLMCNARRSGQGGSGANNRRGGAPRGERPTSLDARRLASACGPASLARRRVPLHPSACRRSASLTFGEGNIQTSEDNTSREGRRLHGLQLPLVPLEAGSP